jgi:hypothetical protein
MRVLVVGINPMESRWGKNHTLNRLARWMPISHYSFVNCIPDVVGPVYKPQQADPAWVDKALEPGYDRVVCLGPLPSRVLTRMGVRHFVLPHPSGRNRLLNDPEFERRMVQLLGVYILKGSLPVRDEMDKSVIGTVQGGLDYRLHPRQHRPADRRREHRLSQRLREAA